MKTILPFIIILNLSLLSGCSGPLGPDDAENVAGTYRLNGKQINLKFCYLGHPDVCNDGEVISSDTLDVSFEMKIKPVPDKKDTIWVTGLEGADVSVQNAEFTGQAASSKCSIESDCPYVKLVEETLEFDLSYWQYQYFGSGTLIDGRMTLDTQYRYRGVGVDYMLEGEKVEN